MEETTRKLSTKIREFLVTCEGRDIDLGYLRRELHIDPNSPADTNLRTLLSSNFTKEGLVKGSGKRDGVYHVIRKVEPVCWWNGDDQEPLDFKFPKSYEVADDTYAISEFGIENCVEVFAGDFILITGDTNYGKTAVALSLLGENLTLLGGARLMGSEYTAADGKISPKFRRRMNRMKWVDWMIGGKPSFELLPVGSDYEDYIKSGYLNVVDWISLPGEYYLIDTVMKGIKDRVGDGVAVAVLQKNKNQEFAEGGQRSERYADVVLKIDPYGEFGESMLTLGKVKSPKGKSTGRTWAFSVVDYGANLYNIREIIKCKSCFGKGWKAQKPCPDCNKKGYVDKV